MFVKQASCFYCRNVVKSLIKHCNEQKSFKSTSFSGVRKPQGKNKELDVTSADMELSCQPDFPNVIHRVVNDKLAFWQTPQGLQIKESILTFTGRFVRMFVSVERYDNYWENVQLQEEENALKFNQFERNLFKSEGAEVTMANFTFKLGGSVKLVTDDRWVDDPRNLRAPAKKDFTIEGIDLRKSFINYDGTQHFEKLGYVRYLNVGDSKFFDNTCMTRLHPLSDTLEYLDISGTSVTPEAFSYLRIFPRLKWLNLSRLESSKLQKCIPYLLEILPPGCVVVTNDELPSDYYGIEIPFRCPAQPAKDVLLDGENVIGDPVAFNGLYGPNFLQLTDVTHVHQMWKTPLISKQRNRVLQRINMFQRKPKTHTLVEYIHKAENQRPLL